MAVKKTKATKNSRKAPARAAATKRGAKKAAGPKRKAAAGKASASKKTAPKKPAAKKASAGKTRRAPAKATSTGTRGAVPFFGRAWAEAAKRAVNGGPSPQARAKKIERFWEWIDKAKEHVNCTLGLAVDGLPGRGADCVLLELDAGRCVRARVASREQARADATYLLTGTYGDWREIMRGYDMGKAVMYRKLRLEHGEVLQFFRSIYYWTESLATLQRIPTKFPATAAGLN